MEPTGKEPSQFPIYALIALILGATGVFYLQNPLKSFRPTESIEKPPAMTSTVEARLWQDPFSAIRKHLREYKDKDPSIYPHLFGEEPRTLREEVQGLLGRGKQVLIMPVMIPGGPWVEDHETRLRNRYAALAALDSAGYTPSESDRIHWVRIVNWTWKNEKDTQTPLMVPYEWCERSLLDPGASIFAPDEKDYDKILVLWIEDRAMEGTPIGKLERLIKELAWSPGDDIKGRVRLLGPTSSDGLKEILEDPGRPEAEAFPAGYLKIYSPWATADPILLGEQGGSTHLVLRTIANDRSLVERLVDELEQRGMDFCKRSDRVAIISEWDTFYGRALPLTFAACAEAKYSRCSNSGSYESLPDNPIRRVIYLRGLDGKLPEDGPAGSTESQEKKGELKEHERPEGRSQLDYVRRLAETLYKEEGRNLKAIGILGSDVYDKLLLLQALRDRFPHAIFFTTDMDARLLHPSQAEWARNLIVASSFDLRPPEATWAPGRGPAPFRDAYQTSLYVAILEALGRICPDQRKQFSMARLYEVGRSGARKLEAQRGRDLLDVIGKWWLPLLAAPFLILAFMHLRLGLDGWRLKEGRTSLFFYLGFFAAIGLGALCVGLAKGPPEPFACFEGISIWPSEILRLVAAFLSFHFLIRAHKKLLAGNKEISEEFSLAPMASNTLTPPRGRMHKIWRIISNVWPDQKGVVDVDRLWQQYLRRGRFSYRWLRIILLSLLYVAFTFPLFRIVGSPVVPYRGDASFLADRMILFMSVVLLILLIFFVVDATMLSDRLIRKLGQGLPTWPTKSLERWSSNIAGIRKIPEEWLNIQLIARHTEVVGSFVVYPFIVLFLMILSRISLFDRWDWPLSLIVVLSLNSACAVYCAFVLRRSAKLARASVIQDLKRKRLEAQGDEKRAQQLSFVIQEIEGLKQGAFAPLSHQPVLRAILMPFGGIGGALLLDYLTNTF
jgi:hypothetical protein